MGVTQRLGTIPLAIQTDSSNNVGIGGAANASYKLAVTGASLFSSNILANGVMSLGDDGTYGATYKTLGLTGNTDGTHRILAGTSDDMYIAAATSRGIKFCVNGSITTRAIITSSGNVGIGTSSPVAYGTRNFEVNGGAGSAYMVVRGSSDSVIGELASDGAIYLSSKTAHPLIFRTSDVQRMSITANGNVLMNTTNVLSAGWLCVSVPSSNYNAIVLRDTGTQYSGDNFYQIFTNSSNTLAGSISHNTATTIGFNTSSDYRLKEDFKDFNGLDLLSNIKFYDFKWKEEDKRMHGVIAHELESIIPLAVSGKKDAVDKEGNIVAQGVDYSKIVPVIGKALQEAMAKIEELNAKVTALENK